MEFLQNRLKREINTSGQNQTKGLEEKWLRKFLKRHDYNIPWYCAVHICKELKMDEKLIGEPAYYCDIKVWLPEIQFGIEAMPPCPNCKSNANVVRHQLPRKHVGREYIGIEKKKYCMGAEYKCNHCWNLRKNADNTPVSRYTLVPSERIKYTFMGWNPVFLPLIYRGLGKRFPAILTHRSGLDKVVVRMFRPLFDHGMRAQAIAELLLELHSLEHVRLWTLYERALEAKLESSNGDCGSIKMFSDFNNK